MGTIKQKKLAQGIVDALESDVTPTAAELLESAGYGPGTQTGSPGRTIEQLGVQEELAKLGFSEENAKNVVAKIMGDESAKARDRLTAADMTFKVHGTYAPEKHVGFVVKGDVKEFAKYQEITDKYEKELLDKYQDV